MANKKIIDYGDELVNWKISEFDKHDHGKQWYIIASVIATALLIYSFVAGNFLFAVIMVLGATIVILHDSHEPEIVHFSVTDEGLIIGQKFIDFDDIKNFSIIYKPRADVKKLYFEFKNVLRPRLSVELNDINPLKIREILLHYLQEDLERDAEPLSESLGRLFKI